MPPNDRRDCAAQILWCGLALGPARLNQRLQAHPCSVRQHRSSSHWEEQNARNHNRFKLEQALATSRVAWEVKVSGLVIIFVYAFFKFAWSYRLFNYTAVLIGAVPRPGSNRGRDPQAAAERAASMNVVAAHHFSRGQRAFFFALAYLGWFVSGYVLIATTLAVMLVMWRRQFASDALAAIAERSGQSKDRLP